MIRYSTSAKRWKLRWGRGGDDERVRACGCRALAAARGRTEARGVQAHRSESGSRARRPCAWPRRGFAAFTQRCLVPSVSFNARSCFSVWLGAALCAGTPPRTRRLRQRRRALAGGDEGSPAPETARIHIARELSPSCGDGLAGRSSHIGSTISVVATEDGRQPRPRSARRAEEAGDLDEASSSAARPVFTNSSRTAGSSQARRRRRRTVSLTSVRPVGAGSGARPTFVERCPRLLLPALGQVPVGVDRHLAGSQAAGREPDDVAVAGGGRSSERRRWVSCRRTQLDLGGQLVRLVDGRANRAAFARPKYVPQSPVRRRAWLRVPACDDIQQRQRVGEEDQQRRAAAAAIATACRPRRGSHLQPAASHQLGALPQRVEQRRPSTSTTCAASDQRTPSRTAIRPDPRAERDPGSGEEAGRAEDARARRQRQPYASTGLTSRSSSTRTARRRWQPGTARAEQRQRGADQQRHQHERTGASPSPPTPAINGLEERDHEDDGNQQEADPRNRSPDRRTSGSRRTGSGPTSAPPDAERSDRRPGCLHGGEDQARGGRRARSRTGSGSRSLISWSRRDRVVKKSVAPSRARRPSVRRRPVALLEEDLRSGSVLRLVVGPRRSVEERLLELAPLVLVTDPWERRPRRPDSLRIVFTSGRSSCAVPCVVAADALLSGAAGVRRLVQKEIGVRSGGGIDDGVAPSTARASRRPSSRPRRLVLAVPDRDRLLRQRLARVLRLEDELDHLPVALVQVVPVVVDVEQPVLERELAGVAGIVDHVGVDGRLAPLADPAAPGS